MHRDDEVVVRREQFAHKLATVDEVDQVRSVVVAPALHMSVPPIEEQFLLRRVVLLRQIKDVILFVALPQAPLHVLGSVAVDRLPGVGSGWVAHGDEAGRHVREVQVVSVLLEALLLTAY